MTPLSGSFSVVLLGSWNPAIFLQQRWIIEHLANNATSDIAFAMPINDPNNTPRISFDDQHIFVNPFLLKLEPRSQNVDGLTASATYANRILTILGHTPVSACGINFTFREEADELSPDLSSLLEFIDSARLETASNSTTVASALKRSLQLEENVALNLTISKSEQGTVDLEFNFHHTNGSNERFRSMFAQGTDRVNECYQLAVRLCEEVYNSTIE